MAADGDGAPGGRRHDAHPLPGLRYPGDADRKIGLFLGLIASAGITVGGYLSMQETSGGERY